MTKPATSIKPGDVLGFVQGRALREVRMLSAATRRGPAPEAQTLYFDQSPPLPEKEPAPARVGPRPTKKARRDMTNMQNDLSQDD